MPLIFHSNSALSCAPSHSKQVIGGLPRLVNGCDPAPPPATSLAKARDCASKQGIFQVQPPPTYNHTVLHQVSNTGWPGLLGITESSL